MALLEARGLCFQYPAGFSLQSLDFTLEEGSFWAVIGPNGCGKSTLVRLLSRYLAVQEGDIRLAGKPLNQYSAGSLARTLAVIPSENHFEFPFPVREVVGMGRFPHLGKLQRLQQRDHEVINRALERTETTALAARPISELSSGERQRVLLARALAQTPRLLILDEPNAHLDIRHQIETFRLLRSLVDEGELSVLVVIHDLTMASIFCDLVALLQKGKLVCTGTPQEVIRTGRIREVFGADVKIRHDQGVPTLSYTARVSER